MKYKKIIFIIILFLLAISLNAQLFNTYHYTNEMGFNSNFIKDITQDKLGRIWFLTRNEIVKYTGYKIITYNLSKFKYQKFNFIKSINNVIYIFSNSLMIDYYYYYEHKWHKGNSPEFIKKNDYVVNEIIKFNDKIILLTNSHNIFILDNHKWYKSITLKNRINSIATDNKKLYIGTNEGLYIAKFINNKFKITDKIEYKTIYALRFYKQNNNLYLAGKNWIGILKNKSIYQIFKYYKDFSNFSIISSNFKKLIIQPYFNKIILGNIYSSYMLDLLTSKFIPLGKDNNFNNDGITSTLIDKDYNLWIAGLNGITKLIDFAYTSYNKKTGLLEDEISSIFQDRNGKIYLGHNAGFTIFNQNNIKKIKFNTYKIPLLSRIYKISEDNNGNIWFAVNNYGVVKFTNNRLIHYDISKDYKNCRITFVGEFNKEIWAAGYNGIYKLVNNKFTKVSVKIGNKKDNIFRIRNGIVDNKNKRLIFNTVNGILILKNNKWKLIKSEKYKFLNSTFSTYLTNDNEILVSTSEGIATISDNKLIKKKIFNYKVNETVFSILKVNKNEYWIGTEKGILIISKNGIKRITKRNSLIGNECLRNGLIIDKMNTSIYIATNKGLTIYNKFNDIKPKIKPRMYFDHIEINGKIINHNLIKKSLNLKYYQNNLNFYFYAISFNDEFNIKYYAKLDGFDKNWIRLNKINNIRYTNLAPGNYKIEIYAINSDGIKSDLLTSKEIIITKSFFETLTFYILLFIVIVVVFYILISLFFKTQYSKKLEQEVKKRTKELKISREKYKTIYEQSLDCIYITTPEGKVIDINPAGLKMFGFDSLDEIREVQIEEQFFETKSDRKKIIEKIEKEGKIVNFETTLIRKDGKRFDVLESAFGVFDNKGKLIEIRGIIRDITDRKLLERQLIQSQKMESLGMLAGGIAHDFNNILGVILGYISLIEKKYNDSQINKYINLIKSNIDKAKLLIRHLLGFARKGKYSIEIIDINKILKDIATILKDTIDKSIRIKINLKERLPKISGDKAQLHQVFMNICINAKDAIREEGEINIKTDLIEYNKDTIIENINIAKGKYIKISISDNGIGISEANKKKIFEPFFSTKGKEKGTGLGLSMAYGVVKNHQGYIYVESEINKGTQFHILLPVNDISNIKKTHKQTKKSKKNSLKNKKIKILLIDDNEDLINSLEEHLKLFNFEVLKAFNGKEGINIFKENKDIDIISLDMSMPGISGAKTFKFLREINKNIKIIINSGYSIDKNMQELLNFKNTYFIQKPYEPKEFINKLEEIF